MASSLSDYARHGIQEYWIIDPDLETIEQYLLRGTEYELIQKIREGSLESEVITGFKIKCKRLFSAGLNDLFTSHKS